MCACARSGTIGGNLCFAEPHADPGTLLMALGAKMIAEKSSSKREIAAEDFFVDAYETALQADEVLTKIRIPVPARQRAQRLSEIRLFGTAERRRGGRVQFERRGERSQNRRGLRRAGAAPGGGGGSVARGQEQGRGAAPYRRRRARSAGRAAQAISDLHGSQEYKEHIVGVLLKRAFQSALSLERAQDCGEERFMAKAMTRHSDAQSIPVSFTLNGRLQEIEVEPHELLLDVVREQLGLTGAKRSCDVQVCGACTLLVDGRPVSACTTLAFEVRGRSVLTIEGLAQDGKLHPLQEAFIEHGGFQCGFCTPGMILAAKALLDENPNPSEAELKHFMHGNICRCTGYKKIIESIMAAAKKMRANA